jgi:hypothetical protein
MLMNIATKVIVDMREFRWDNHICLVTESGQTSVAVRDPTFINVTDLASFSKDRSKNSKYFKYFSFMKGFHLDLKRVSVDKRRPFSKRNCLPLSSFF